MFKVTFTVQLVRLADQAPGAYVINIKSSQLSSSYLTAKSDKVFPGNMDIVLPITHAFIGCAEKLLLVGSGDASLWKALNFSFITISQDGLAGAHKITRSPRLLSSLFLVFKTLTCSKK